MNIKVGITSRTVFTKAMNRNFKIIFITKLFWEVSFMLGLNYKLRELEKLGREIRVGLIGCGQMGRGMISQIESMKGMRVVATADLHTTFIQQAYIKAGVNEQSIVITNELEEAEKAIEQGKVIGTH
jgi:predicted homoserine dehydrogenase-like protein